MLNNNNSIKEEKEKKVIFGCFDLLNEIYIWTSHEDQFANQWFSFEKLINDDYSKAVLFEDEEDVNIFINNMSFKKLKYFIKYI